MNATIMKGERSKLLAVAVVLAMVACALVAFMPAGFDAVEIPDDATDVSTYEDFTSLEDGVTDVKLTGPITIGAGQNLDLGNLNVYLNGNYITLNGGSISNGTVIGSDGPGIRTYAGTISGVTFDQVRSPVMIYDGITGDINITGCTFGAYDGSNTSASAIYAVLSDGYTITVSGNTFNGIYREGMINVDSQPTHTTKLVVSGDGISMNVFAENSDISIGNDVDVSEATLTNVNIGSGSLVVPEGQTLVAETVTGTGVIEATADQVVADVDVAIVDATSGNVAVGSFSALKSTLSGDVETITLIDNIVFTENLNGADIDGVTIDLNQKKIELGEFGLSISDSTIKNGTITKTGGSSSNGVAVNVSTGSIENMKFIMTESEEGYMPFALSFSSGENSIVNSSFTANGERFAAMQENFGVAGGSITIKDSSFDNGIVVIKEYGKMDIQNSGDVIISVGLYGGNTGITVPMNKDTFTYSGNTNITETVIGWDPCTLGPDATYQGDITLEVSGDYDLGMITTGAVEADHQTNVLNIRSGNVTADGGYVHTLDIDEGASFDSTEIMNVELLTMHDASQIPDNVYPAVVDVTTSTGDRRPVASDFAVIQYTPTYYTGKATDALYYIARPSNVNVSVVTILDSGDDIKQTNVGDYTTDMRLSITYTFGTGAEASQDTTTVTLTFNWSILPAESVLEFGPEDVTTNPEDSTEITVSGDVTGTDGNYSIDVAVNPKIFGDNGILVDATEGYTLTVNGDSATIVNGRITLPVDSLTGTTPVTIVYDADGNGTNYAATTYTINFGELEATLAATIDVIDQDEYGIWELEGETDKALTDFYDPQKNPIVFGAPVLQTDGSYMIAVTGTLQYMESFPFYGTEDTFGWYLPLYIQLPGGFDWSEAKVKITNATTGITSERGPYGVSADDPLADILCVFLDIGKKGTTVTIEFTFNDNSYSIPKYVLDLSGLEFETVSGYMDNGNAAGNNATETLNGITVDNVVGQTMWMIDNSGKYYDKTLTYGVWYGDTLSDTVDQDAIDDVVYVENGGNYTMWYFSFIDGVLEYQQNEKGNADYVAQPGLYTMKSWYVDTETDEIVVVGTAQAYKTGANLTGFESYEVTAETEIAKDLEGLANSGFTDAVAPSDMRDRTLWMSYFQYGYDSGDYKLVGTLSYGGSVIFTDDKMNDADGNRLFYLSFDDQLAKAGVEVKTGTYTMTVTAYAADDEDLSNPLSIIASATVDIEAEDSAVSFDATEATDIWGTPVSMIQTGIRFSVDDTTDTTIHAYGSVYYLDSFEAYWGADDDKPGYYIAFDIASIADLGGFLWDDAVVTMPDGDAIKIATVDGGEVSFTVDGHDGEYVYAKGLDGTFIMYLGDVESFSGISFEMTVDFDGNVTDDTGKNYNAPFYNSVPYTIDVSNLEPAEPSYNLILSELMNGKTDEYVYENGELVIVPDSQWFTVHNGPNGNYATAYWMPSTYTDGIWAPITDENKRISADTTIDLAYYDALDGCIDYTVKLYVIYEEKGTTGGAAATSYNVTATLNGNQITIEASNLDGEANADAYFVYVVEFRDAEDNVIESMTQKFGSALRGNGPTSVSTTYTLEGEISSDYLVDVTLIGVAGSYEVVYGFTTTFLE